MHTRAEILVVDYDNKIPKTFKNLFAKGYRIKVANGNIEAFELAKDSDLIIGLVSRRKREMVKFMEHVRYNHDPSMNFIVIMGGGEDRIYSDRIDKLTFQCFKKYRFSMEELLKAINNAIEMRALKIKEKRFLKDLDRIEEELREVEHRLFTLSSFGDNPVVQRSMTN